MFFAIYSSYLKRTQNTDVFKCSPITELVANQSKMVLEWLGYQVKKVQHSEELSVFIALDGNFVGKIVEGCNSISLIILFVAFIIAFSGSLKPTLLYLFFGSLCIYTINIIRIVFLCIMLYKFPLQEYLLHKLVFPAIIYGVIFLLWVLWVNKFSNHKK